MEKWIKTADKMVLSREIAALEFTHSDASDNVKLDVYLRGGTMITFRQDDARRIWDLFIGDRDDARYLDRPGG